MPALASRHGAGIDSMLHYLLVDDRRACSWPAISRWRISSGGAAGATSSVRGSRARRTEIVLSVALGIGMALVAEGGVIAIGMPVWAEYFDAAPPADATVIEVTAQQFMWNVRYPGPDGVFGRTDPRLVDDTTNPLGIVKSDPAGKDDVVTLNEITVPFGRAVHVLLRSKDVIHSFFLPNFRVKQDAVPGMTPEVVFFPTRTGTFELACAELCGLAHYRMRGTFNVVPQKEFAEWLRSKQ